MTTNNAHVVLKICFVLFISGHFNLIRSSDEAKRNYNVRRNLYNQLIEKIKEREQHLTETRSSLFDFFCRPLFVYSGLYLSANVKKYKKQYGAGNGLPVSFYVSAVCFVGASLYLKGANGRKKNRSFSA